MKIYLPPFCAAIVVLMLIDALLQKGLYFS